MDNHHKLSKFLSELTEDQVPTEIITAVDVILKISEDHSRSLYFADPEKILIHKKDLHHCLIFFNQRVKFYYAKSILEDRVYNLVLKRIIDSVNVHIKMIA